MSYISLHSLVKYTGDRINLTLDFNMSEEIADIIMATNGYVLAIANQGTQALVNYFTKDDRSENQTVMIPVSMLESKLRYLPL